MFFNKKFTTLIYFEDNKLDIVKLTFWCHALPTFWKIFIGVFFHDIIKRKRILSSDIEYLFGAPNENCCRPNIGSWLEFGC